MEGLDGLEEVGAALRAAGLTERAVCLCFGVPAVIQAARRAGAMGGLEPPTPAAVLPWLFVGGREVALAALEARLGREPIAGLERAGLLEADRERARARRLLLPIGESLVAFQRPEEGGLRPDDSAFHLIGALRTRRVERWLDVGTGTGIAPLARRGLSAEVLATDVDPDALALAELGARLSGADEISFRSADLLDAAGNKPLDLVTFNAPLPEDGGLELVGRLLGQVKGLLAGGGEVLIHSAIADAQAPFPEVAGGDLTVALYTPEEERRQFGVTRWRPFAADRRRVVRAPLTAERPHLARGALR